MLIDGSGRYFYLYGSLLYFLFAALFYALGGPQRKIMLFSGAITVPFIPMGALYTGEYWTPLRLFGLPFGIEDALWLFSMGATSWFCATLLLRNSVTVDFKWRQSLVRLLIAIVPALLSVSLLMHMGISWTVTAYIVPSGLAAIILLFRPRYAVLSAFGSVFTGAVCLIETNLCFVFWPHFLSFWTTGTVWREAVLGVPVGDILFSVIVGACHPVLVAYATDARIGNDETGSKIDPRSILKTFLFRSADR